MNTALVTGATSGIGEALAHECARHGRNVVVVSRDEAQVLNTCQLLERDHGVKAIPLPADLSEPAAPEYIYKEVEARGLEIDLLINDAGLGAGGLFHEIPLEKHLQVIRLNIEGLTRMCRLFLPDMVARDHGYILNVGSVAGFQPGPLLAVYHASKAFVVSLSEAMAEELKDTQVIVSCLCPGPTDTHFFERADMEDSRVARSNQLMDPVDVARGGYEALMNGERVYIPGGMNKAMTFLRRLMPESAQAKFNKLLYQEKES